jgi:hypothetical protein
MSKNHRRACDPRAGRDGAHNGSARREALVESYILG